MLKVEGLMKESCMKQDNIILTKSFDFSVRIVKLYQYLCDVLSKQLLRSGTSIGANANEAQAGQSKADFISKMSIASKEARETKYWIDLNIHDGHTKSLLEEIIKLLTSIVKNSHGNTIEK